MKVKKIKWNKLDPANLWPRNPHKPAQVWRGTIAGVCIGSIRKIGSCSFGLLLNFHAADNQTKFGIERHNSLTDAMRAGQSLFEKTIKSMVTE